MTGPDRGDLEDLLRRALREHADHVVPAGDGLRKIQDRIAHRRRSRAWLRPALATLAAAAAAVAIIVVPTFVHGGGSGKPGNTAASGRRTTPPPAKPTHPALWPYASEEDAAASADPRLRQPGTLAVEFVRAVVGRTTNGTPSGPGQAPLAAGPARKSPAGLTVAVIRTDTNHTLCTVHLSALRAKPAAYVVEEATSGNLSITPSRAGQNTVGGTVRAGGGAVRVWAKVAPSPRLVGKVRPLNTPLLPTQTTWTAPLENPMPGHGILLAWTVDGSGYVLDFSARRGPG